MMMYQGLRDPVAHHAPLQTRDDEADVDPGLDPGPPLLLTSGQPQVHSRIICSGLINCTSC